MGDRKQVMEMSWGPVEHPRGCSSGIKCITSHGCPTVPCLAASLPAMVPKVGGGGYEKI